jgi:hypothetical protein
MMNAPEQPGTPLGSHVRIPTKAATYSKLMAATIPS